MQTLLIDQYIAKAAFELKHAIKLTIGNMYIISLFVCSCCDAALPALADLSFGFLGC